MPRDVAASTDSTDIPVPLDVNAPAVIRHSAAEDILGILTGTFLASFGLYLLKGASAVTGGTAGIALLLTYVSEWPFGLVFFVVNTPFFLLALWQRGLKFSLRTLIAIALVSGFAFLHTAALGTPHVNGVYAVFAGNLIVGVAMLILFRHHSSLGGINVVALIVQDRLGWRAGYVQMAADVLIILLALAVVPVSTVAVSAAGAVLLNFVLAMNHRPGRYLGG